MFYSLYFPLNHKVRVNGEHEVTEEDIEENLDPVKTEQSQQRWVRFSIDHSNNFKEQSKCNGSFNLHIKNAKDEVICPMAIIQEHLLSQRPGKGAS